MLIKLLFVLFFKTCLCSSSEKLYYYGQPTVTSSTGFIKIDPITNAWEPAANGFPTEHIIASVAIGGAIVDPTGSSVLFGSFSTWNGTYAGNMISFDFETMDAKTLNSGLLGTSICDMTYVNNYTQLAILGSVYAVAQNPNIEINQVALCASDGQACFGVGTALEGYSILSGGTIRCIGSTLYVLYNYDFIQGWMRVASLDLSDTQNQNWTTIYPLGMLPLFLEVFQDELWLFGKVSKSSTAARWRSSENSWEFMNTTALPTLNYKTMISVSPDGQSLYLCIYAKNPVLVFTWNTTILDWSLVFEAYNCTNTVFLIAALNNGFALTCNNTIQVIQEDTMKPYVLNGAHCENSAWFNLVVSTDNTQLYTFCGTGYTAQIESFDLVQNQPQKNATLEDFQEFLNELSSMCVYGEKIFISGNFEQIDNQKIPSVSIWDNNYKKWYAVSPQIIDCACATDGTKMVAACWQGNGAPGVPPLLITDWANSDSGSEDFIQEVQIQNVTDLSDTPEVQQVLLEGPFTYILTKSEQELYLALSRWSDEIPLESVVNISSSTTAYCSIHENMIYWVGALNVPNSTYMLSAARYNMSSGSWLSMDQIYIQQNNFTSIGNSETVIFEDSMQAVYVGGSFNLAGDLRVLNWVGYNQEGQAIDSMSGGVNGDVKTILPMGDVVYLLHAACGSAAQQTACGTLLSYNLTSKIYSPAMFKGVGNLASGMDTTSDQLSNDSQSFKWQVEVIAACVICGVLVAIISGFLYRKFSRVKKSGYQELPVMMDLRIAASSDPIDFQHENFVLKSLLGRGAYGTVWSCVFPHRKAATYAVKQMLFSKGETKQIELVQKEIEILEKFRHPHIVHYCGYRMETTQTSVEFFIFLELYEQPSSLKGVIQKRLKQASKTGKSQWFAYEEIKNFLCQIADGLHYLHLNGVAHRDLKCANILVKMKGSNVRSLHIADFGISRVMAPEHANNKVLASTVLGTPSFMAPEIFANQKYDAFKADIWSFGMMLYEMLVWKDPETPGRKPLMSHEDNEVMNKDSRFLSILDIFDKCAQADSTVRPSASDLLNLCESLP